MKFLFELGNNYFVIGFCLHLNIYLIFSISHSWLGQSCKMKTLHCLAHTQPFPALLPKVVIVGDTVVTVTGGNYEANPVAESSTFTNCKSCSNLGEMHHYFAVTKTESHASRRAAPAILVCACCHRAVPPGQAPASGGLGREGTGRLWVSGDFQQEYY